MIRRLVCPTMHRAFASAALSLAFGFAGLTYQAGYKPYVSTTGYKPYVYTTGYKPYLSGKGYKPVTVVKQKYVAPANTISRPFKKASCLDNAWELAALAGPPLTFCMIDVSITPTDGCF